MFQMLVSILDHHDRRIHHRADRDRDTAERHQVRRDALQMQGNEGDQHAQWQRDHGHQRRAQVPQKQHADQRHHQEFFEQLAPQILHRGVDQSRAVIGGHDLDAGRQAALQFGQPCLHGGDGGLRVLARAHHDNAADHLALTVQLGEATTKRRATPHRRHIAQQHRHTAGVGGDGYVFEVRAALQVAFATYHQLRFALFDHRAAVGAVRAAHRIDQLRHGDAAGSQRLRIGHDLPGAFHTAQSRHLGNIRHGFELIAQEPVLQRTQLAEIVLSAAINQRVFVNPAQPRGIGTEGGRDARRQTIAGLAQVLQHARTGPVQIGAVVEQHVDVGVTEKREGPHRRRAGHREHGGGQWIGDLILDYLRRLARVAGADDHLGVGQIGQRVDRRARHREHAHQSQGQCSQQHEHPMCDRRTNQGGDHGLPPIGMPGIGALAAGAGLAVVSFRRSSAPDRLASESIRNWPETTTFSPPARPSRISV